MIVGGGDQNGARVVDAEIYDPALGTWSVLAPFQHQHILGATVLFNGEVVVIGGGIKDVERLDLQPVPTPTPAPTPVPTTPCVPVRGACWQSLTALGVIQGYPVAVALSLSSILAVGQPDVNFPLFTTEVFSGGSWVQGRDFSSLVCPSLTTLHLAKCFFLTMETAMRSCMILSQTPGRTPLPNLHKNPAMEVSF